MLSCGVAVVSALLLIPAETSFDVGGRFESQVGRAPTGLAQNAAGVTVPAKQTQVLLIATPALSLRYLSSSDELRATSFTRALWRPQPLLRARPLFLESIEISEIARPSLRTRWRLDLRGSYGEEDYSSLSQQFVTQPTLPPALTVFLANANGEAFWRASRRTDLTVQLLGIYRRTVDTQTPLQASGVTSAPTFVFPPQTTVSVAPGVRHVLSRQTTIEASVPVMDTDIGANTQGAVAIGAINILTVQPQFGIRERLTPNHQLHLAVGVAYAVALRHSAETQSWPPLLPLAQIDLASSLRRSHDMEWRSTIGAAVNAFADPVLGVEVLRGTAQARIDTQVGEHWGVGALALFATDINGPLRPLGSQPGQGPSVLAPDETVLSAEIPFHYRWANQFLVELGGRFVQRAPHLRSPDFAWRETSREMWIFLSLSTITPTMGRRPSSTVTNASRSNASSDIETPTGRPPAPALPSPL